MFFGAIFVPISWMGATTTRVQEKRLTLRTAYTGLLLTLFLIAGGVSFFMTAVAQLSGRWETAFHPDGDHLLGPLYALLGLVYLLLASLTGGLAIQCYSYAMYGEISPYFQRLQALPAVTDAERKQNQEQAWRINRIYWSWLLGFAIVFAVVAWLDHSFFFVFLSGAWNNGFFAGLVILCILFGLAAVSLMVSLIPLAVLYVLLALVQARWGPPREPRVTLPANFPQTRSARFVVRVLNLFPLTRAMVTLFWLVILVLALGLAAFELHARLSSENWPRSSDAFFADLNATTRLALAVFYLLVSLLRLVWLAWDRRESIKA